MILKLLIGWLERKSRNIYTRVEEFRSTWLVNSWVSTEAHIWSVECQSNAVWNWHLRAGELLDRPVVYDLYFYASITDMNLWLPLLSCKNQDTWYLPIHYLPLCCPSLCTIASFPTFFSFSHFCALSMHYSCFHPVSPLPLIPNSQLVYLLRAFPSQLPSYPLSVITKMQSAGRTQPSDVIVWHASHDKLGHRFAETQLAEIRVRV